MKTLFLLRHAKSSWDDRTLSDFQRPLNDRGLRAAPFMGSLIRRHGFSPSVIVSSPAARAGATAELVRDAAGIEGPIAFDHRIYEASPQGLRQVVSELDEVHPSALLVGHNPGIEGFIRFLTGQIEPMPTAALAVIALDINEWNELADECGTLHALYRPKDEMKAAIPSDTGPAAN